MAAHFPSLPPVPTPPPVPLPPATSHAPQSPASPQPVPPAALLALLLADGIVGADVTQVDFCLSQHEFTVNGQPQSAALLAKYRQRLGLAGGAATVICLKAEQ
jgi:hypothetical protein